MSGLKSFDLLEYLEEERNSAKKQAWDLLWENIEGSIWWGGLPSGSNLDKEKISIQYHHYHPVLCGFRSSFYETVFRIDDVDVKSTLLYGASRRLHSIYRAVNEIAEIAYPERTDVANGDDKYKLDDSLLLVYVHMMGFFDALAIAFYQVVNFPDNRFEGRESLFDKKFRNQLKSPIIHEIFGKNREWFDRVNSEMRHRFVHRVPLYVPPAVLLPNDHEKYMELQTKYDESMREKRFDELSDIQDEQEKLGQFVDWMTMIEVDGHMPLLSTVLDDVLRFQYIALVVFEVLAKSIKTWKIE